MSELAVECTGLTKAYRLGQTVSLRTTLDALLPWREPERDGLRALDKVTFSVPRGSFFGIVGSNAQANPR